jgi:hypothetical protein
MSLHQSVYATAHSGVLENAAQRGSLEAGCSTQPLPYAPFFGHNSFFKFTLALSQPPISAPFVSSKLCFTVRSHRFVLHLCPLKQSFFFEPARDAFFYQRFSPLLLDCVKMEVLYRFCGGRTDLKGPNSTSFGGGTPKFYEPSSCRPSVWNLCCRPSVRTRKQSTTMVPAPPPAPHEAPGDHF